MPIHLVHLSHNMVGVRETTQSTASMRSLKRRDSYESCLVELTESEDEGDDTGITFKTTYVRAAHLAYKFCCVCISYHRIILGARSQCLFFSGWESLYTFEYGFGGSKYIICALLYTAVKLFLSAPDCPV